MMIKKLIALTALLLLLAASVAAYSYANLNSHATMKVAGTDTSSLGLDCSRHSMADMPDSASICSTSGGDVRLDFGAGDWRAMGQMLLKSRPTGPDSTYVWDDLVRVRNQTETPLLIDVNVKDGWPDFAGIGTCLGNGSGYGWFIKPGYGDTGYTHRLDPYATMYLDFHLKASLDSGLSSLLSTQPVVLTVGSRPLP